MKSIPYLLFFLTASATAQLNQRFYSNGNPTNVVAVGALGANTYLTWRQIQPTSASPYDWSFSDALVQAYQSEGLELMITLSCTHPVSGDDLIPGTCAYIYTNGSGDNNANWPVTAGDTTLWKQFVNDIVDRYNFDSINDMPGLMAPVSQWHIIGQEWNRVWCDVPNADTSFQYAKDFVKLVNITYPVIKNRQPQSIVSYAGIDIRFQGEAFYDGYLPATQTTICNNIGNCSSQINSTPAQLAMAPKFLPSRRNVLYILKNAFADEVDIHQYGRWNNIPDFVKWTVDSSFGKPVIFMEGGGPFCPSCEDIHHSAMDTDGRLPADLIRDNASYVVYYYITALANHVRKIHWNLPNEYSVWGATWGDLDLLSINNIRKPSFYTYRFLAKDIFSGMNADTVVKIPEANPSLYHYLINPLGLHVVWSVNPIDSIVISGIGELHRWDIPITCDALYPTSCDSIVQQDSIDVNGNYTLQLNNGTPVFYSWNNVISIPEIPEDQNLDIKIFPNPSTGIFFVKPAVKKSGGYRITDPMGRVIKESQNQDEQIDLSNFPSGTYFLYLWLNDHIIVRKLLKT